MNWFIPATKCGNNNLETVDALDKRKDLGNNFQNVCISIRLYRFTCLVLGILKGVHRENRHHQL